jgi:hypothetical protein
MISDIYELVELVNTMDENLIPESPELWSMREKNVMRPVQTLKERDFNCHRAGFRSQCFRMVMNYFELLFIFPLFIC